MLRRAVESGHRQWAPMAAAHLALLLTERNDLTGACEAYRIAIRSTDPDVAPRAATNLGILLVSQGDTAGACEAYRLAMGSGHAEEAPRAAVNLGVLLSDSDRRAASDAFELAIRSGHPEQAPMAQMNLAALLLRSGDEPGARQLLQAAIASGHPEWAERCKESLRKLDEVHRLARQTAAVGEEWLRRGELEQAILLLAKSVGLYRELSARNGGSFELFLVGPLNNLGVCLHRLRRFQEALPPLEQAIAIAERHLSEDLEPILSQALESLAAILGELGEVDRALPITDRLVGLRRAQVSRGTLPADPNLAKALRMFALFRGAPGVDLERALAAAREATSSYELLAGHAPDEFGRELESAYVVLAAVLERLGRNDEALRIRKSTGVTRMPWQKRK